MHLVEVKLPIYSRMMLVKPKRLISFNYVPIDLIGMIIFFWYGIKYISLIAIGYTIVIALLTSLIGHFKGYFW